jgi:hypothetical protein
MKKQKPAVQIALQRQIIQGCFQAWLSEAQTGDGFAVHIAAPQGDWPVLVEVDAQTHSVRVGMSKPIYEDSLPKALTDAQKDKIIADARKLGRKQKAKTDMRYLSGGIPRQALPKGRVLVHNHVILQRKLGLNGFRAWTQTLDDHLVECRCDWAGVDLHGLVHYRVGDSN